MTPAPQPQNQVKPGTPGTAAGGPGGRGKKPMGQRGPRQRPKSRYGQQMAEKQSFKKMFGIREEQLRKYYAEALRSKAQTGQELVALLERRLDNALYRAGFAPTRPAARQLSTHRLFTVNGRPVDVPSYRLKAGDVVSIREGKRSKPIFSNLAKRLQNVNTPSWITTDPENFGFKVNALPSPEEANLGVDVQAIVEFFAR